ncbi:PhaM family polyhydroxyalkanoate granule multifunctional regulatory protein [Herminiimonas sp. CN]|uniref:PhaM family polyhydroxyalkanoate granule multifunctional regulatory protein n=1 Tax=Herminiimonas sp. CN TaxID=1349818 RepID=UPI000473C901|nr:PhaM family polyhydroxyalkanoate granule multifunctional regulatory protein [Herminiimonas sp. CN]
MTQGNMSGAGPMSDTLEFVKKLWGGMSVPGMPAMVAPTLSVEELEQKINDLKTVESWLSVNMSMLRNTIQAMEVQRATIGTLQSMSAAFQSAVDSSAEQKFDAAAFWASLQAGQASPAAAGTKAAEPAGASAERKATINAPDELAAQMTSPAAWWGILQNQFKQAVSNAVAEPEAGGAAASAKAPATPRKPAAKSAAKPAAARKRKPAPKA